MLTDLRHHPVAQQGPMKAALSQLLRIPSVCVEGEGGYPFGEGVDRALCKALEVAGGLGFRTYYGDGGYYGFAVVDEDPYATHIFGVCADKPSGRLKFNVGKIELGEVERLCIGCRIPVTVPKKEVVAKLSAAASKYGLQYHQFDTPAQRARSAREPV